MDVLLIGIIIVGCLVLATLFGVAAKPKGDGCLPVILVILLMALGLIALALLD